MCGNSNEADSIRSSAIGLFIASVFLCCMLVPKSDAADPDRSFAALFRTESDAGFGQDQDEELSLKDLLELEEDETEEKGPADESDDDSSTDSILDLGDDDEREDQDDRDDEDEAMKVAKSKQDAVDSALARLRKPLHQIRVINSLGSLDGPAGGTSQVSRDGGSTFIANSGSAIPRYQRQRVCFSHRPLYFEQRNLERCGNSRGCLTNAFSAVHFVSSLATLPYQMTKQRPNCPVDAGGDCRCGQTMPVDLGVFPIDLHAAAVQTAAVAGFTFLLL